MIHGVKIDNLQSVPSFSKAPSILLRLPTETNLYIHLWKYGRITFGCFRIESHLFLLRLWHILSATKTDMIEIVKRPLVISVKHALATLGFSR